MNRYSTISVPEEVKARLEESKGDMEWGEYLLELVEEAENAKRQRAYRELRKLLSDEDIENIRESSRKFREEFKLR